MHVQVRQRRKGGGIAFRIIGSNFVVAHNYVLSGNWGNGRSGVINGYVIQKTLAVAA